MLIFFINGVLVAQWSSVEVAPMPERVSNNAAVAVEVNGKEYVYSFSGIDSTKLFSGIHKRCFKYDVDADQWTTLPDLPSGNGRIAAGASVINGKIYIVGGYEVFSNGSEISVRKVHIFNPVTDSFMADASDIPVPIDDHVQDVWRDSLLYVVTGWSNSTNVNHVQIYNPSNDTWSQAAATPNNNSYKVFGGSGAIIGDTIYYSGGAAASGAFSATNFFRKGCIDRANPFQITWSGQSTSNARGYRMAASNLNDNPIWFGGSQVTYNFNGIAYNGSGGVPALGRIKQFVPAADSFTTWNDAFPPQMDFRGLGKLNENRFILAGGMVENQSVTDRTLILKYTKPSSTTIQFKHINISIKPNPFTHTVEVQSEIPIKKMLAFDSDGRLINTWESTHLIENWPFGNGIFYLDIELINGTHAMKKIIRIK